jgi:hypothetical protein
MPSGFSAWHFGHFIFGLSFGRDSLMQISKVEVGWEFNLRAYALKKTTTME